MPRLTWAGSHANVTTEGKLSVDPYGCFSNPQDYIFFLSKDEVPYGCFSNAYHEQNGHYALAAGADNSAGATAANDDKSSHKNISSQSPAAAAPVVETPKSCKFWCINQELHYQKAILFHDHTTAQQILAEQNDATKIKQLGRQVQNYNDDKWCQVRYEVCRNALHAKFAQNEELKRVLLGTGTLFIVEAAKDAVWGIGCVEFTANASDDDGIAVMGAKNMEKTL